MKNLEGNLPYRKIINKIILITIIIIAPFTLNAQPGGILPCGGDPYGGTDCPVDSYVWWLILIVVFFFIISKFNKKPNLL